MSKYDVRFDRADNSAIAVGKGAIAAHSSQVNPSPTDEAIAAIGRLIELIRDNKDALPDAETVTGSARAVSKELKRKRPNLSRAQAVLAQIITAVSDVSVLADAAAKVQQLITHL